ncbi:hypothetical protein BH18CHL2_BH18CHL2_00950 [soil metagenome]
MLRVIAGIVGIVGLYLKLWHNNVPGSHFAVFGQGFGTQHVLHSVVGLVLLGVATWVWIRSSRAIPTTP